MNGGTAHRYSKDYANSNEPECTHAFGGKRIQLSCFNFDHIFNVASFFLYNYRIQLAEEFRCVCVFQSEMSKEFPNSKGEVGSRLRTTSMADSSGSRTGPDPMGMKRFTSEFAVRHLRTHIL